MVYKQRITETRNVYTVHQMKKKQNTQNSITVKTECQFQA